MRKGASFTRALLALIAATVAAQARSSWKIDPSQTHVRFWVDAIGWPRTTGEFVVFEIVVGRARAFARYPNCSPAAAGSVYGEAAKRPNESQIEASREAERQRPGGSHAAFVNA